MPRASFRLRSRSGTHMAPFSIEARRRFGNRSSTPWQMSAANVSEMPRSWKATSGNAACLKPSKPPPPPSLARAPELAVLRHAAEPGVERQRDAGLVDLRPHADRTSGGRARRSRRRRARGRGSSRGSARRPRARDAHLGRGQRRRSARVIIGAAYRRPSPRSKPQSSSSHRLKAVKAACSAGTSCLSASCMPTPSVGNSSAPSMPCSSSSCTPGVAVAVAGVVGDRLEVAEHRLEVDAVVVAAAEVVLEAARLGDRVEGGVRDELVDPARPRGAAACR